MLKKIMTRGPALGLFILCLTQARAQAAVVNEGPIRLWPNDAPGALGTQPKDVPTLTPFLPAADKATGAAMIVCPGGGYGGLMDYEGADYARWLADQGIAGFVLKYRLGPDGYHYREILADAKRAMRLLRFRAGEWKLDPKRIGIIGSSAGGHLAATLLTHFDAGDSAAADPIDRVSCRPDLGVLCYAVVTMGTLTHGGSRENFLGPNPTQELIDEFSAEKHVTPQTPSCFIFHTDEDKAVPVENSLEFAAALRKAKVPFELHIYQKGPHGVALGSHTYDPSKFHPWTFECRRWLAEQGFGR